MKRRLKGLFSLVLAASMMLSVTAGAADGVTFRFYQNTNNPLKEVASLPSTGFSENFTVTEGTGIGDAAAANGYKSNRNFYEISGWKMWSFGESGYLVSTEENAGNETRITHDNLFTVRKDKIPIIEAASYTAITYTIPYYKAGSTAADGSLSFTCETVSAAALPAAGACDTWVLYDTTGDVLNESVKNGSDIWATIANTTTGEVDTDVYLKAVTKHTAVTTINKKEATCEADGYTGDEYCSNCQTTIKKGTAVKASGHKWDNGTVTKEATAEAEGEKIFKCTNASCTDTKTEPIAKMETGAEVTPPAGEETTVTPGTVSAIRVKKTSLHTITLEWDKVDGAEGYTVYRYKGKEKGYVEVGSTKKLTYQIKDLSPATGYTFRVAAYIKSGNEKVYGESLKCRGITKVPAPTGLTIVKQSGNSSKTKATLSWNAVKNATGYYIYEYMYQTKKFELIGKIVNGKRYSYNRSTKKYTYVSKVTIKDGRVQFPMDDLDYVTYVKYRYKVRAFTTYQDITAKSKRSKTAVLYR